MIIKEDQSMTPEEYIEGLKDAQRALDAAKDDLDRAIRRMEKRLETGYESMERDSRIAALAAREEVKLIGDKILKVATTKIEY